MSRRRVPSFLMAIPPSPFLANSFIDVLIQVTLDQTKARGSPVDNELKRIHRDLTATHRKFNDKLTQLADPESTRHIEFLFELAILDAYLLGSKSPEPSRNERNSARITKAMAARAAGWEKPVEEAIAQAFKTMDPDTPNKVIIDYVRDEMKRRKIKIPEPKGDPDSFLRKRIQPHRERARYIAENGPLPF
jgi:hypothetical protein